MLGREVLRRVSVLESGTHSYKLSLSQGFYTLRLQTADGVRTARVVSEGNCLNHDFQDFRISRINNLVNLENLTEILVQDKAVTERSRSKSNTDFPIEYGDTLDLQGFITEGDAVLVDKHTVPLTEDTHVVFAFTLPPPPLVTITWTAELNNNWYPLDSVVITNKSNNEKTIFYYPDTSHTYFPYEYGDTLVLLGFISDGAAPQHTVMLIKDSHITFVFWKPDTICNCIMDTLKGEWKWVKILIAGDNPLVIRDNSFTSILKILNQNEDNTVNYEIWIEDSLFSQGSFQFKEPDGWESPHDPYRDHRVVATVNIKHFRYPFPPLEVTEEWNMNMLFTNKMFRREIMGIEEYTTYYPLLVLFDRGFYYCYQKIK